MIGPETEHRAKTAAALLDWYAEMGCTEAVDESGTDWLAKSNTAPGDDVRAAINALTASSSAQTSTGASSPSGSSRYAKSSSPPRPPHASNQPAPTRTPPSTQPPRAPSAARPAAKPAPADGAVLEARIAATAAPTLEALSAAIASFDGCGLKRTAKNVCVFRGAETARIAVIGEAPGRDEDLAGKPFVGAAGQLLDRMLAAIGLNEDNTHITNVVYWRPPGNRAPTPQEVQTCQPFLERQLEMVDPDVLFLMGGSAAKQIFATTEGIMRTRGKWRTVNIGGRERRTLATLHPAYLLRTPSAKHMAWKDLQAVRKLLAE
ncbi:MAG: uracil-DNA glycosylase family protein [Pseudomonadota bacterium]